MEGDGKKKKASTEVSKDSFDKSNLKNLSLEELDSLLNEVLEQEDYIRAISVRDEIKSRTKG
jgi:protein-arginine kinase activator protein McsA